MIYLQSRVETESETVVYLKEKHWGKTNEKRKRTAPVGTV